MVGVTQSVGKPADMICLCVGGRLFVTRRATLYRLPDSRLFLIATEGLGPSQATGIAEHYYQYNAYLNSSNVGGPDFEASEKPSATPNVLSASAQTAEQAVVGGASPLPNSLSSMLAGNMHLKSASSLCRNRPSVAPGTEPPPPDGTASVRSHDDLNESVNLSVPLSNSQQPMNQPFTFCPPPPPPVVYFYDRDPEIFRFVLDYYRTGELHLPGNICGPFVRKELIFWGIDESLIGPCCMPDYMRYDEEKRTKNTLFRDCFEDINSMQNLVKYSRGMKKWRYRIWLFLDHPTSSFAAKSWASILLVLMIASVMCYCLSTHEVFRMPATVIRTLEATDGNEVILSPPTTPNHNIYLTAGGGTYYDPNNPDRYPISPLNRPVTNAITKSTPYLPNDTEVIPLSHMCTELVRRTNPKLNRDCTTEPTGGLVLADITLNCLFTAEFIIKIILAPDKPKFLSSIVSLLDIIILSSYWVYMALFYGYYYYPKMWMGSDQELRDQLAGYLWLMNILSSTQVMRIMRIFKISKISRILRVLILTVKKSIPELVLLGFLLMNGMFLFSCLMYIAEYQVHDTFPNIPQSFWWSIITLTSVGYGDMHPKGGMGYFVGSVTAICGCIVTGLAIPIIGNNFNTYYKYMKNQLMEDKFFKKLRKENDMTGPQKKGGLGAALAKAGLPLPGRKNHQGPRTVTPRAARSGGQPQGLRARLDRLLSHFNPNARSTKTTNRFNEDGMGDQNEMPIQKKRGSMARLSSNSTQPLTEGLGNTPKTPQSMEHSPLVSERRMMVDGGSVCMTARSNFSLGGGNGIPHTTRSLASRRPTIDSTEVDRHRLSLIHPLATDKLLSSLPPSHVPMLNAPQIWLDGEDATELASCTIDEDEAGESISNNGLLFTASDFTDAGSGNSHLCTEPSIGRYGLGIVDDRTALGSRSNSESHKPVASLSNRWSPMHSEVESRMESEIAPISAASGRSGRSFTEDGDLSSFSRMLNALHPAERHNNPLEDTAYAPSVADVEQTDGCNNRLVIDKRTNYV